MVCIFSQYEQTLNDSENESLGPDGALIAYFIISFFVVLIKITASIVMKVIYIIVATREKGRMDAECDRKNAEYRALMKSREPVDARIREKYIEVCGEWVRVDG